MATNKKPNRSKPRVFKAHDVGRIARYSRDDGADPIEIITRVIVSLGYGQLICQVLSVLRTAIDVKQIILSSIASVAAGSVISIIISILSRPFIRRIPLLSPFVILISALLINIKKVVDVVNSGLQDIEVIEGVIVDLELSCELSKIIEAD
jgi:hypothetical protein